MSFAKPEDFREPVAKSEEALIEKLLEAIATNQALLQKYIAKCMSEAPVAVCRKCETLHNQAMAAEGQGACAKGCDEWLTPITPSLKDTVMFPRRGPRVVDNDEDERKDEMRHDEARARGVAKPTDLRGKRGGRIDGARIVDDVVPGMAGRRPKHGGRLDGKRLE